MGKLSPSMVPARVCGSREMRLMSRVMMLAELHGTVKINGMIGEELVARRKDGGDDMGHGGEEANMASGYGKGDENEQDDSGILWEAAVRMMDGLLSHSGVVMMGDVVRAHAGVECGGHWSAVALGT